MTDNDKGTVPTAVLVDGDSLVYRCGFAAEKTFYLVAEQAGENTEYTACKDYKEAKGRAVDLSCIWTRKEIEPIENCLHTVKSALRGITEATGSTELIVVLSGKSNFREDIYPEYKANRINVPKPKYYREIRDYLVQHWKAVVTKDNLEADDLLGIYAMQLRSDGRDLVIVTQDKDLDQIPGRHYDWTTAAFEDISPEQGIRNFYTQLLTGDSTDNIKGCPGIGPAKAKAALEGCKSPNQLAQAAYKVYETTLGHRPDSEVELNAQLVWIKRRANESHPFWRHLGRERT